MIVLGIQQCDNRHQKLLLLTLELPFQRLQESISCLETQGKRSLIIPIIMRGQSVIRTQVNRFLNQSSFVPSDAILCVLLLFKVIEVVLNKFKKINDPVRSGTQSPFFRTVYSLSRIDSVLLSIRDVDQAISFSFQMLHYLPEKQTALWLRSFPLVKINVYQFTQHLLLHCELHLCNDWSGWGCGTSQGKTICPGGFNFFITNCAGQPQTHMKRQNNMCVLTMKIILFTSGQHCRDCFRQTSFCQTLNAASLADEI